MKRSTGFTLIELLVYVTIVILLLLVGIPGTNFVYQKNQTDNITNELKSALEFSRNLAFMKGLPLVLNPWPATENWADGMVLFEDNERHHYSSRDKLIYQWHWSYPGIQVKWKGFLSQNYIILSPLLKQSSANGTLYISTNRGLAKKLIISRLGHLRVDSNR